MERALVDDQALHIHNSPKWIEAATKLEQFRAIPDITWENFLKIQDKHLSDNNRTRASEMY
jgi:hypothetical protein